jgi:hypothetical protein
MVKKKGRKQGHSEIPVFINGTSFESLFQHIKYFHIKSSDGVKKSEQRKG